MNSHFEKTMASPTGFEPVLSRLHGGMSWGRVENGRTRMNSHFEKTMASPTGFEPVLPA